MDKLFSLLSGAPKFRHNNDDDFADRLSSRYTVVLLIGFALLVGMTQYVRNPITCWAPAHFSGAHAKYMTSYCWVKSTYYLQWDKELPRPGDTNTRRVIPYYQWIPFILIAQATLFLLPSGIWHGLNSRSGVDADSILMSANTFSRTDRVENRDRTLKMLVNQFDRFLSSRTDAQHERCQCSPMTLVTANCCYVCGRRVGNYLVILFLVSKLFYIANVIGQLFALNAILGTKYDTFGVDMAKSMANNQDWTEESYVAFPRVTMCDFQVRGQDMGNVQTYTVQCVLPINIYNEKIFVFLWFWMVFVAAASVASFLAWFVRSVIRRDRVRFVRNHLPPPADSNVVDNRLHEQFEVDDSLRQIPRFVDFYLQQDGVFLLRLIAHNTNGITTTEIATALLHQYIEKNRPTNEGEETEPIKQRDMD